VKSIAVIGCGLRANAYTSALKSGLGTDWQVIGLADPNPLAVDIYRKHYGSLNTRTFKSGPELIAQIGDQLDGVIIASPNQLHLESVVPALRHKLITLLEKPVAVTLQDCRTMWKGYVDAGLPPLTVGFSLRYTPFYRKVKELIDSGSIGQVLSMEATEMMGAPLTSFFTRGWRRNTDLAGPMILEKCCHDMDLLSWLVGSVPVQVSSFGTLTRFVSNPDAAMRCRDCSIESSCRYSSFKIAPYWVTQDPDSVVVPLLPQKEDDLCVFNSEKNVVDHQVVNIEYGNGVLAAFTVCMDQPRTTRTIKVNGTLGQIAGDLDRDELSVIRPAINDYKRDTIEVLKIQHDGSGHNGGDGPMAGQFKSMLRGDCNTASAGMREGIEACLVALAADISIREGRIVSYQELAGQVF